jgi:LmbE family N-acetylglucosaminyl deacetylase
MEERPAFPAITRAAVVVAHPDDETLWAGGTILAHPEADWFVAALCRGDDPDRARRFLRALERLGATGRMAALDDGPRQIQLPDDQVQQAVLSLMPAGRLDLVLTHGPRGEYTRHRRHEETCRAVAALWASGRIAAGQMWLFAYDDAGGCRLPRAVPGAHRKVLLSDAVWVRKRSLVTDEYGFAPDSFEARATPREEAFWCFASPGAFEDWMARGGARG